MPSSLRALLFFFFGSCGFKKIIHAKPIVKGFSSLANEPIETPFCQHLPNIRCYQFLIFLMTEKEFQKRKTDYHQSSNFLNLWWLSRRARVKHNRIKEKQCEFEFRSEFGFRSRPEVATRYPKAASGQALPIRRSRMCAF
jgi:hypothetical protein